MARERIEPTRTLPNGNNGDCTRTSPLIEIPTPINWRSLLLADQYCGTSITAIAINPAQYFSLEDQSTTRKGSNRHGQKIVAAAGIAAYQRSG
jgi:hypothetical protein